MGSIVVGRRRSDPSDSALRFASAEAQLRGRPLTLMHVWDLPVEVAIDLDAGDPQAVPATARAVSGSVAVALMAQRPELLVLGGRGSSSDHLSRVLREVLHHVQCPLVVVPHDGGHDRVHRIVVGVSDSAASAGAARWAAAEAALHHAELVAVHAWQLHPHDWHDLARPVRAVAQHQHQAEDRHRHWVRETLPGAQVTTLAPHGGPLDAILGASRDADLVVVGYTHHERLSRVLHGHLADDLALRAPCPIAVIPVPTTPGQPDGSAASGSQ